MTPRRDKIATIFVACLAELMVAIDMTVLHLAIPALTAQLGATSEELLWIADVYGFAMGGLLVTMGNLGDRFGRRRMLIIGATTFAGGSLLAAYAPSVWMLVGARALLGVAGAAVLPSATSLLRAVFTTQRARTAAIGASSGVSAAGFAIGPIVGGLLLDHFWWGTVFLVNVPVTAVVLLAARMVPESRSSRKLRLDPLSVLLSIVGIIGIVYAFKSVFYAGPWSLDVLLAFAVGGICLIVFARRQHRLEEPLIDLELFRNRGFAASVGSNLISVFTMSAFALINSQYFQLVLGWDPLRSGLAFVPGALAALLAGGVLAAKVVWQFGRAWAVSGGLALAALGFGLYGAVTTNSDFTLVMISQVAFGAGAGLTLTVTGDTILGTVPRDRAGAAASISTTAYELGGSLGIAVVGSVLTAVYQARLVLPDSVPADLAARVQESFSATAAVAAGLPEPVASAVRLAAEQSFVGGIRASMLGSAVVMVVLSLTALRTLRRVPKLIENPLDTPGREADQPR
ncbi:MFS transporter [Sciscionella sediminilitoris]|uniref:MFS transporter n=1 Tax=Sciscionella sediminilitoris TaxID=1445613 RepID=UPI0004DF8EF6|nr:MFS transporter [Sciscionella sp. SE31]